MKEQQKEYCTSDPPVESAAKKAVKEAAILREKAEAMGDGEEEKAKTLDMLAKIDDKLAKQATSSQAESSGSNIEYTVREWHPYNGYEKPKCVDAQVWHKKPPTIFCLLKEIQKHVCSRGVVTPGFFGRFPATVISSSWRNLKFFKKKSLSFSENS